MVRVCTICSHESQDQIDRLLLDGIPRRRIAAQFGVSETALRRHHGDHIPAKLAKAQEAAEVAQADDLLAQLKALRSKAIDLLIKSEKTGDFRTALAGVREARGCLETMAKLQGELSDQPTINVLVSPIWATTRDAIIESLLPYPDARIAVAERLMQLEAGQ